MVLIGIDYLFLSSASLYFEVMWRGVYLSNGHSESIHIIGIHTSRTSGETMKYKLVKVAMVMWHLHLMGGMKIKMMVYMQSYDERENVMPLAL